MAFNVPNAYTKARAYMNGGWYLTYFYLQTNPFQWVYPQMHYNGLINLYNYTGVTYKETYNTIGQRIDAWNTMPTAIKHQLLRNAFWENIGRILHLIQDMSVPCHAHNDTHVAKVGDGDSFHEHIDNVAYTNYNYMDAYNDGGIIATIGQKNNPLRYLMYTANQIADFYPSYDEHGNKDADGNKIYSLYNSGDYYAELAYFYNVVVGTRSSNMSYSTLINNYPEMERYLYTMAIRLSASFLYWIGQEIGDYPTPIIPVTASISGPSYVQHYANGTFVVSPVNGSGNFNYQWWYKFNFSGEVDDEFNSSINNKNSDEQNYIPQNQWHQIYTNSTSAQVYAGASSGTSYSVKCIVTDITTNASTTAYKYFTVSGSNLTNANLEASFRKSNNIIDKQFSTASYPNPFNPVTRISYFLPKSSHVIINVYNILGQKIKTLENGYKFNGSHFVLFEGNDLASGTYIYQITAEDNSVSRIINLSK